MKHLVLSGFCLVLIQLAASGQTPQWTTVSFGNLECEFPKGYQKIDAPNAGGIFYDGGNVYLTVTGLLDTSSMKGNLDREYTQDFMNVVLDVSRKLNGRVREFRDTVIANMPGYLSKLEVKFEDGKKSYYELLQVLQKDTIRGFSAQYFIGDADGLKMSERFFQSVKPTSAKSKAGGGASKAGIWIGVGVLLILGVVALLLRNRRLRNN